ncbi:MULTISPECIES: hypothetical protein [Streptomyces]|uniref:hypothetical protein n=1 Tax=Streptomyces TaxID=1883 RepID=UPI000B0CA9F0|nr:hypothetical protein [Streptomyces katrae]
MTIDAQESTPRCGYGQPSPELLARAERGLLRFLVRWPQSGSGTDGHDGGEGSSDV